MTCVAHKSLGSRLSYASRLVSSYSRTALYAVGQIPMSVQYAERTAFTVQGVSVVVHVLCQYREPGSGSVRSGLSLLQLLDVFVVLALGLLLAAVSLLIELCHRHVTAAPTVCLRCASLASPVAAKNPERRLRYAAWCLAAAACPTCAPQRHFRQRV